MHAALTRRTVHLLQSMQRSGNLLFPQQPTMRTAITIILLVAILTGLSCSVGTLTLQKGDRIIFFGDSITELGDRPNGYISLVREELTKLHPDFGIESIGAGISGNKVNDLQGRLQRDVLRKNPTVVVIYIGINDVWHWVLKDLKGTTQGDFERGLREIIARIQYAGARVVLCTPSVIGEKFDGTNPEDAMLDQYAQTSRKVAEDLGVYLCDLRKAFLEYLVANNKENKDRDILTYDRVHLNDEGNRLVAREMLKALGEL